MIISEDSGVVLVKPFEELEEGGFLGWRELMIGAGLLVGGFFGDGADLVVGDDFSEPGFVEVAGFFQSAGGLDLDADEVVADGAGEGGP